ncbi:MAG: hypothetical protein RLZZ401_1532 [Pseudomonadota bacterium]
MPAPGTWVVDSELNGQPGRGFNLEVENEILVFAYYGYRSDGSAVFYSAVGAISQNTFTAELVEYKNGKSLGGINQSGSRQGSPGNVTINFTSGLKATITLPGEAAKAISKLSFGYGNSPEALLGTYLFAYITPSPKTADIYTLTKLAGTSTSGGNGLVLDANSVFSCENMVSGTLAGNIVCMEHTNSNADDQYFFKMSGDRGSGVGKSISGVNYSAIQVVRTATKSGQQTGVNDSTTSTVFSAADPSPKPYLAPDPLLLPSDQPSAEETVAMRVWVLQARMALSGLGIR